MLKVTDAPASEWTIPPLLGAYEDYYVAVDRFGETRKIPMYHSYNMFMTLWDSRSFGYDEINPNLRMWSYSNADDAFEVNVPATSIIRALARTRDASMLYRVVYGAVIFTGNHVHDITRPIPRGPYGVGHDDAARLMVFCKLARDEITKDSIMTT